MEDLVSNGNADHDIEQDESSLIWIFSAGEKSLKLVLVSRIIPGQRTAIFRRYLRPEKDYLSFSLIYNNGKRSLDLENRKLVSTIQSDSSVGATQDTNSLEVSVSPNTNTTPKSFCPENSVYFVRSHVPLDQGNMQVKGSGLDVFRVSVSSAPSNSSHGSAPDDCDALGEVYIWGEAICDNPLKVGTDTPPHFFGTRADVLLPRPLESNVVLDVHHIACGVKHAALVTRQGEVFTWGEESGGRLGHGFGEDVTQPRLVEFLSFSAVDIVACGEFHTCAVTMAGELYTWGDGTHNAGLLGHGTDVSHWIPKRISGSLEGFQVAVVTCGPWHTALVTSTGQLFTFGDGTFGVLGHGDRENISYPREVESLSGLRTIAVACGVWHTAAVVEVIVTQSTASVSSGKLFTWGDGDKNRLGHGDKEPRLKPTCVPALIDYNFHKIACGHSLTVGLTTSGHVFTMGSTVYGQLGNPQSDGKVPCFVKDKLVGESIEEIACGAYHVAALTTRNEVYTWGKGANGRLGHGDIEDRKTPTLVEALKDRHVKFIACGSNYTAAICLHKWVSGAEQSQCSTCRQAFGFTRKRHNCYNCGLVHCHSCSSRKALRAALAPNPNKPYRVCDSCFAKLSKVAEAAANNRRNAMARLSGENKYRLDKAEMRLSSSAMLSNVDLIKQLDNKATKQGRKADAFSFGRPSQALPLLQLKDAIMSTAVDLHRTAPKPVLASSAVSSRSVSPFSRRPSPPRSATPVPTATGLSFSKSITDSLKKTNDLLNQEVRRLRLQVESLQNRCELQDLELKKSTKKAQEAITLAAEEATKCKAAKEVIKSLAAQLKHISGRLPSGAYNADNIRGIYQPNGLEPNGVQLPDANGEHCSDSINSSCLVSSMGAAFPAKLNGLLSPGELSRHSLADSETSTQDGNQGHLNSSRREEHPDVRLPNGSLGGIVSDAAPNSTGSGLIGDDNAGTRSSNSALAGNINHVEAEWIEQYEPGVYITLVALKDGTRDLKRVRFSRRRFGEHQAETWWSENREKVYEKYNVRGSSDKSSVSGRPARRSGGGVSPSSQL